MVRTEKDKGQVVDCPCCEGTGAIRVYTLGELQEIMSHKEGQLRGTFDLKGKRYQAFLAVKEIEQSEEGEEEHGEDGDGSSCMVCGLLEVKDEGRKEDNDLEN